jgi:hypothetical protein
MRLRLAKPLPLAVQLLFGATVISVYVFCVTWSRSARTSKPYLVGIALGAVYLLSRTASRLLVPDRDADLTSRFRFLFLTFAFLWTLSLFLRVVPQEKPGGGRYEIVSIAECYRGLWHVFQGDLFQHTSVAFGIAMVLIHFAAAILISLLVTRLFTGSDE